MKRLLFTVALIGLFTTGALAADYHLPANNTTVHWGYFSKDLPPVLSINSGDTVTVEALTHHANDAADLMVEGDPGAESVYYWTAAHKAVDRRGAGLSPDGEGKGVHILTGPIYVEGAAPGDVIEVQIMDLWPRPSGMDPKVTYGSNAAAAWGYHYKYLSDPREVITIYEVYKNYARALYNYRWTPQTDPFGTVHPTIDYPGVPVDHNTITKDWDVLEGIEVLLRPHFGVIGVASDYSGNAGRVDSIPPSKHGGNIDNWRMGAGGNVFLPVQVAGALVSFGDPHASQGDSELCGTAVETSLTGRVKIILHKGMALDGPLIEREDAWVVLGFAFPDYLNQLADPQNAIYSLGGNLNFAMGNAYLAALDFLMEYYGLTEDETISLLTVGVDFGITQVVDGNYGVHAVIPKCLFENKKCK